MFKYISSILAQFTQTQRILALSILVFSIIFITLGPSFIGAITLDRDELYADLSAKEKRINFLEGKIDTLSDVIIENQKKCTDQITEREEEFIKMLDKLKKELQKSEIPTRVMKLERFNQQSDGSPGVQIESYNPSQKALGMIDQMKVQCRKKK